MAFDGKLAVQTAFFDALTSPGRADGLPVFQHVPDNQEPPFVLIERITLTPAGGKAGGLDLAEVDVTTEYAPTKRGDDGLHKEGREFVTPIMAENRARIDGQVLAATGASLSTPVFESDDDGMLGDGITYFGTQRFSLFVQPSD